MPYQPKEKLDRENPSKKSGVSKQKLIDNNKRLVKQEKVTKALQQENQTLQKKLAEKNQVYARVTSQLMLKALQHHGYNQPDLKSWWTDGKMIEFVTLSGYIKQVQITDLDS